MLAAPDQQISLTDPESRSMATSGRGSGVVGYNVQVAVDTEHHLIITHEVTNDGQRPGATCKYGQAGEDDAGIGPASMPSLTAATTAARRFWHARTSWHHSYAAKADDLDAKARRRFGKQDFRYVAEEDVYICPAGRPACLLITQPKNMDWFCTAT